MIVRGALILLGLAVAACAPKDSPPEQQSTSMASAPSVQAQSRVEASTGSATLPVITVYKSPTCGCCESWVQHVKEAGFKVEVHDVANVDPVKDDAGVPASARSCHTAIVGGYAIEGHVPASTIRKLLAEHPDIAGLAVPGMPVGSPGMEVPGQPAVRYDVVAFMADGRTSVFESH